MDLGRQSGSLGAVTPPARAVASALALRLCSANAWGWAPRLLVPGPAVEIRNWGFGVSASGLDTGHPKMYLPIPLFD